MGLLTRQLLLATNCLVPSGRSINVCWVNGVRANGLRGRTGQGPSKVARAPRRVLSPGTGAVRAGERADKQGGYRQGPGLVLKPCRLWQSEGPLCSACPELLPPGPVDGGQGPPPPQPSLGGSAAPSGISSVPDGPRMLAVKGGDFARPESGFH